MARDTTACDHHRTACETLKHLRTLLRDGDIDAALSVLDDLSWSVDGIHEGAEKLEARCRAYREAIEGLGFTRDTK